MAQEKTSAVQRKRLLRRPVLLAAILVLLAALVAVLSWATVSQTRKVQEVLNNAAYQNTENTLRNLSSMVSNTFALDQRYLNTLASAAALAEDRQAWLDALDYDTQRIQGVFFCEKDSGTAVGKHGAALTLSDYTFVEHENGQVRSQSFMTAYGTYSYLLRAPVLVQGERVGDLYLQYPMSRMRALLPQSVANGNDVSIMEASTLTYVYIPSTSASGVHVNYKNLKYYLRDPTQAPAIIEEIEQAIRARQYYMRILTFAHAQNAEIEDQDYVVYLWPVDDGEYYISGFSKVEYLQSERVSVERTIRTMITMLLGISGVVLLLVALLFGNMARAGKRKAQIQKKHNDELNDALQIARSANESKSNFLSNMSHDIRTPMNAIVGYTTLITREADDPAKVREYTKKISGAGDYLLSLINDVLDMSKIESGKTTLNISQFRLREMVGEIESIIRMQADARQQRFTVQVEQVAHDAVLGDKLRIRQIILNLLSNAVKYTPDGGSIQFTVQGLEQPKQNLQKVRIVVRDTGYGMEADYLKTIFEPFTRLDNTMTGKIQGTGLGLAITKNIVDLMGGTITVQSVPNKGSTFTVELELPVAPNEDALLSAERADPDMPVTLRGLRVLAAEDNELNAEILEELLSMEGVVCTLCENGEQAAAAFAQARPGSYDLILMEIQMPVLNGYEATKRIRASAHPEAKTIPIVAMTANAFAEDVLDALQAGMNAHIAKPVDMNVLKKTFRQVLRQKKEG